MSFINYKKDLMDKSISTKRTYNYEKGGMKLEFTIDINDKKALTNFRALLQEADRDVEIEINAL